MEAAVLPVALVEALAAVAAAAEEMASKESVPAQPSADISVESKRDLKR